MLTNHVAKNTAKTGIVHLLRHFCRHFLFLLFWFTCAYFIAKRIISVYMSISLILLREFLFILFFILFYSMYVFVLLMPIDCACHVWYNQFRQFPKYKRNVQSMLLKSTINCAFIRKSNMLKRRKQNETVGRKCDKEDAKSMEFV